MDRYLKIIIVLMVILVIESGLSLLETKEERDDLEAYDEDEY